MILTLASLQSQDRTFLLQRAELTKNSQTRKSASKTMSRRSVLLGLTQQSLEETSTRLPVERVITCSDLAVSETMMTLKKDVVVEVEEVVEAVEVVAIVMTEALAEVVEAAIAEREAKSSLRRHSQLSEVVASAIAATKVSVKGLDHSCAF